MSTLRANTLKPITSGNSLVLQGDSGGSGVSGPSIDSNGDVDFTQNTDAKVKLPSGGGIYESDGSTEILTESSGAVTLKNTAIDSTVTMSANQSAVKTALNASGSAPIYACRAWVNFDGTFGTSPFTVANGGIRASGNVSSVTDQAQGIYKINFETALPDADYSCAGFIGSGYDRNMLVAPANSSDNGSVTAQTASGFWLKTISTANVAIDTEQVQLNVIR